MAGQIRISPEQMRERASEYQVQAGAVGDVIARMDTLLSELQAEWEGEASVAYAQRFEEVRPSFLAAQNLIDDIALALISTATALEEADASIASRFRM